MPAFNAARTLPACLAAIRTGAPDRSEVVVVDDASLDATADIARDRADTFVLRPCRGGAARARNDGALASRGRILLFVDADVVATSEAIAGALAWLTSGADAVFGAYQPLPPEGYDNVATTYKNLLHHHTHLRSKGTASTFWSGFGAVTRAAFFSVRGFDCAVSVGADVEDVHLGYRLRAAGYHIVLDPSLQVAHRKQYRIRQVVASDVFHRAVPWTKAMLELRTFRADLNLRRSAIVSALLADTALVSLLSTPRTGWAGAGVGGLALGVWFASCRPFLRYARRVWGWKGLAASTGLLYLYFLYGQVGAVLGLLSHLFESGPRSMENKLRLVGPADENTPLQLSVAVTVKRAEDAAALTTLPPVSPDWELLVVSEERPPDVPEGARFIEAPSGATRQVMRDLALAAAKGRMFASLDGSMAPDPGWLTRMAAAEADGLLAVGGSFYDHRRRARARALFLADFWEWRTNVPMAWVSRHPLTNFAARTDVVRQLGGFIESELIPRLGGFGGFPVRFDPAISVRVAGPSTLRWALRRTGGDAWRNAAAMRRYRDLRLSSAILLSLAAPPWGIAWLVRRVVGPIRDGGVDRTSLASVPVLALLGLSSVAGKILGLLWPAARCESGPRSYEELVLIAMPAPATAGDRVEAQAKTSMG
ncbi:MAG: glycosyltransferase [Actinomycetota bacterium]|nr:glycosyltransferase [Actinomycetota bacterium]